MTDDGQNQQSNGKVAPVNSGDGGYGAKHQAG
jgi:hypothetical protein